jgi:AraC-like DNA-binding protein
LSGHDAPQRQRRNRDAGPASATQVPPHVSRITTRNLDEHQAFIAAHYQNHKRTVRSNGQGFEFFAEVAVLDALTAPRSYYKAATVQASNPPATFLAATRLHEGQSQVQWQGGDVRVAKHGMLLVPPYPFDVIHGRSDTTSVSVTMATLLRVAEETSDLDPAQVRFTALLPMSKAAQKLANATIDCIRHGIYTLALHQPLLLAAAEHMVAAILLTTFPNTTMTTEVRTARDPATPATVRRAIAFIDEHADQPITLTDIATAVGVVSRTQQYAFPRHQDTTPMDYLRRVRLDRAHDELLAAQPGDDTTVAAIAARWGYARTHRFAAAYHQAFGQAPGQTLRS